MLKPFLEHLLPLPSDPLKGQLVKVLIVEDDANIANIWATTIRQHHLRVEVCGDMSTALMKMLECDAMLLDWRIQGSDSRVIFDTWLDRKAGLPIAVVSGYLNHDLKQILVRDGAHIVLDKPVELEALLRVVHRFANHVRRDKEIHALRQDIAKVRIYTLILLMVVITSTLLTGSDSIIKIFNLFI